MSAMRGEDGRELHVVGDRVLIAPDEGDERTRVGLYLPATAVEGQQVQGGRIVATGPGDPVVDPSVFDGEPWRAGEGTPPRSLAVGDLSCTRPSSTRSPS